MFGLSRLTKRFTGTLLAVSLLALPALATGATYYVDTAGNDANDGLTPATAWKTITNAAATVTAGTSGSPNVIMVAAGTYDNTTNGETFPINFTNNYVSLTGAGSGTTTIDAEVLGNALDVDGMGFSVSGFTFENAPDAIDISEGGFTISNNIFETTVGDGVNFYRSETDLNTSISFGDMSVTNNSFKTGSEGVYVYVNMDFDDLTENLSATFGNMTFTGNTFDIGSTAIYFSNLDVSDMLNGTASFGDFTFTGNAFDSGSDYIYFSSVDIEYLVDCTVTFGDITVTNNTFNDGFSGFDFYGDVYELDDSQVTIGDMTVSNNTFMDQSSSAIDVDYWDVTYMYGTSSLVMGDATFSSNTISSTSSADGIYLSDFAYIDEIFDESTITTGTIAVTDNTVFVDDYGLYLDIEYIEDVGDQYWGDTAMVTFGPATVTGNMITSTSDYGVYVYYYEMGYDVYGESNVIVHPFTFSNNTVNSYYQALYLDFDYWGESVYEDATVLIHPMTFSNNTLNSSDYEGVYFNLEDVGDGVYGNASVTMQGITFINNTITSGDDYGFYIYYAYNGYSVEDNGTVTMSPITIDNNTIFGGYGTGLYVEFRRNGNYMSQYGSATLSDWIITNNTIDVQQDYEGIYFEYYYNYRYNDDYSQVDFGTVLIDSNIFNPNKDAGMDYGIYFYHYYTGYYAEDATQGTFGQITITNNQIYNPRYEGISFYLYDFFYSGVTIYDRPVLTLEGLEIADNMIDMTEYGIWVELDDNWSRDGSIVNIGSVDIHDNTLTKIADTGIYLEYYSYNEDPGDSEINIDPPMITDNSVTGFPGFENGIYLYVDNDGADEVNFGTPSLTGNTVTGFDRGMYVEMYYQDEVSISCNYLENNDDIGLRFETDATGLMVANNSFVGNTTWGLSVDDGHTAVVDAENNWWGDKLGPGACASCNGVNPGTMGTVDYDPWMVYRPDPLRCGQPFPWILYTPATTGMSPVTP